MTIGEAVRVFNGKRSGKGRWVCKCPSHRDRLASMTLREGKKAILIHCFAGCPKDAILAAVGLRMRDMFYASRDVSSESLKKLRQQQAMDKWYEAEKRIHDLKMLINAIENPRKCKYVDAKMMQFERDIEAMCQRLSQ